MVAINNVVQAPVQVPIQVPPQARAQAPNLPVLFTHNSSYVIPGGVGSVANALTQLNTQFEHREAFRLSFSIADEVTIDVEVQQYLRADGQTIVEFRRLSGCTVEFNDFLRGDLVEQLRNYGIVTLGGAVVPRRDPLPRGLP